MSRRWSEGRAFAAAEPRLGARPPKAHLGVHHVLHAQSGRVGCSRGERATHKLRLRLHLHLLLLLRDEPHARLRNCLRSDQRRHGTRRHHVRLARRLRVLVQVLRVLCVSLLVVRVRVRVRVLLCMGGRGRVCVRVCVRVRRARPLERALACERHSGEGGERLLRLLLHSLLHRLLLLLHWLLLLLLLHGLHVSSLRVRLRGPGPGRRIGRGLCRRRAWRRRTLVRHLVPANCGRRKRVGTPPRVN